LKNPVNVTLVAVALAALVNGYYFATGTDLTVVVSRTLFADMLLVLTLVPVYESVRLKLVSGTEELVDRVKAGLKPVAMYTILVAIMTFTLFKLFGEPLVAERIEALTSALNEALSKGEIDAAQKTQQLELANQVYSSSSHVLVVLIGNLFTGFISSLLAALLVRK
jgi:hypothetical protein